MKFSYNLLKKLNPKIKSKKDLIDKLNFYFFEAEDALGDTLDISVPPNRFSDAASHLGIASEFSAISGIQFKEPNVKKFKSVNKKKFNVLIKEPALCRRASVRYIKDLKIGPSPKWMQKILKDCGMRPINNLVDITNYVMLETGQPLHAFDSDKMEGESLIIRRAKQGEKLTTLDNKKFILDKSVLVLADEKDALDIAGTKGGKKAEITAKTKNILLTACNFYPANIYKTTRKIKLETEASMIFSHGLSPALVEKGINRAIELIVELCKGKPEQAVDVNFAKLEQKIIKFDLDRFNKLIGIKINPKSCQNYLKLLGFKIKKLPKIKDLSAFLVEVPLLRQDIEGFEDLAEEVIRLYGYNKLKSVSPYIHLSPSGFEDEIILKDKIMKILTASGFSEMFNYSFIGEEHLSFCPNWKNEVIELANPISGHFKYMRPSLAPLLIKNINNNLRFFEEVKLFEIGRVFKKNKSEKNLLGIVLASKIKKGEIFFELKGLMEQLLKKIGLVDFVMPEFSSPCNYIVSGEALKIQSGKEDIGFLARINNELTEGYETVLAEIDLSVLLKLIEEEYEYRPLPKYPSIMRDLSILVEPLVRVSELIREIQQSDLKFIEDVDLIDEFELKEGFKNRSLTFRIVFQAKDRSLTNKEVNEKMETINKMLKYKFRAEIR
ncbi:phenylalanine--tRNA ligase subunit beta [Candidatus Wolfebacteria bacterium]|nr:phenylalanine--tRNA ligase subunit beta [Candidatus Wolfebacteria bacterium]